MKRIVSLLLLIALIFALAACGSEEPDPNAGVYEASTAEYSGITVSIDTLFPNGFSLELKNGGKATFHYDGKDYGMKWKLDGTTFHAEGGGAELDGTLSDGVMILKNVLDSGVSLTLVNPDHGK
jgi:hypothetical protein